MPMQRNWIWGKPRRPSYLSMALRDALDSLENAVGYARKYFRNRKAPKKYYEKLGEWYPEKDLEDPTDTSTGHRLDLYFLRDYESNQRIHRKLLKKRKKFFKT
jgi:hypothetical protein